ncbi:hypothetical protein RTP6_004706 [Batrachochytrium dendrobatidis]
MHYLSVAAMTLVATFVAPVAAASRCGPGRGVCPGRKCCSARGFCAITAKHCGVGCQTPFGYCFDHPDRQRRHKKPGSKLSSTRPTSKKPAAKKSTVKKSTAKKSTTKKSAAKKPAAKKTATKKTATKKTAIKKTATKKTAIKKPSAKKSAAKKPAVKKPATPLVVKPSVSPGQTRRHVGARCGPGLPKCANAGCCSSQNVCGLETDMCEAGCQPQYGECIPGPSRPTPKSVNHQSNRINLHHRPCINLSVRREFRELTQRQRDNYVKAVRCLQTTPSSMNKEMQHPSLYYDLVNLHRTASAVAHTTAMFLPWHRVFIQTFEDLMRDRCGYEDPLPYWDWSLDSQAPERSEVWSPNFMGGNGNAVTQCVTNGPFADSNPNTCIKRRFLKQNEFPALCSPAAIFKIITEKEYSIFTYELEKSMHKHVHFSVGGHMAIIPRSTTDPAFFLHHTMIDKVFWLWQKKHLHTGSGYEGYRTTSRSGSIYVTARDTDHVPMWGMGYDYEVREVLDVTANGRFCYTYSNSVIAKKVSTRTHLRKRSPPTAQTQSEMSVVVPSLFVPVVGATDITVKPLEPGSYVPPWDRKDQHHIRHLTQFADEYYLQVGDTPELIKSIREDKDKMNQFIDQLNKLTDRGDYISASAMILTHNAKVVFKSATAKEAKKRDDELEKVVQKAMSMLHEYY